MSALAGTNHPRRRLASSLCAVGLLLTGVLSLSAVVLPAQEAGAATDTVTNCSGDPGTAGSLPNEIAGAGAGDTIVFSLSCSTITLTSTIVISQDLTINGPGQTSLAVDGGGTTEPFQVSSGTVSISGLTIQNGSGTDGGGIENSGNLTVSNSSLASNSATGGGGAIDNSGGGTLTVTSSTLSGNSAGTGGGAIDNSGSGTLTVTSSTLSGNSAGTDGGAIDNLGTVTVEESTLSGNTAGNYGGGIESNDATMTVDSSTVSGNSAISDGGGVDIEDDDAHGMSTIDNSTVTSNGAPFGGGIQDDQGPLTIGATIVAESTPDTDCAVNASVTDQGYNIDDDGTCAFTGPGNNSGTLDGTLGSLANNGGPTQTVALEPGSPASGLVTAALCPATDQRGVTIITTPCDAGAYDTNGASISSVTVTGSLAAPTVTISGTGFGSESELGSATPPPGCPTTGSDYDNFYYFSFSDVTAGWQAGQGGNCTGVSISGYSGTGITFTFGSGYGNDYNSNEFGSLGYGDSFQMSVLGDTYNGSIAPFSPTPTITSVTITGTLATPTVTVSGSGFGMQSDLLPPVPAGCSNTGSDYDNNFYLTDGWGAGEGIVGPEDCTGVFVSSYTSNQITFTFGNGYGSGNGEYGGLSPGDSFQMHVLGATYDGTVPVLPPSIDGVTFGGNPTNPTVTVSGSGFGALADLGTAAPSGNGGSDYGNNFYFSDNSSGAFGAWQAGQAGDTIGLVISVYSDDQITFTFDGDYSVFGPVSDGDSFSVRLFGVTYNGTASLGTGYTCAGFGSTSFPVVVSESPAPPASIDDGGTFQTAPAAQLTIPATVINDFIGDGATSLTIASQTTAIDGLNAVGGSPSGAVDPSTESGSASNLPLSHTLAADTPFTYDTSYNPVTFQTGPGTGQVFLTPGAISAEVTLVIGGTPTPESISCTPPSGVAALGTTTVNAPAAAPTFQVPPSTPPLQNQVSAGTDGGWGATIANTSRASVTGLSARVRVTDGHGTPTFDLAGMAASGTTCANAGSGKLTCSIGTLAAGAADTLDVLVDTNGLPDGATITGSATVTSSNAGTQATTLGAIGVVVVEGGDGTKAVAAPGIALVSTKATLKKAKASVSLTLPKAKIKVKKRVGEVGGTGPSASGTITISPPPVAVTLESLSPSAEPALCPPTGSTKCEGNIIQVFGNFSLYTSKLNPIVATVKFFYGTKVPAGTVYFLKPNGKTVDKLSTCKKTASGYDTPCLSGAEKDLGTTGNKYAEDTVYFTGNDPAMGRR